MNMLRNHISPGVVILCLGVTLAAVLSFTLVGAEEPPDEPVIADAAAGIGGARHPVAARILTRVLSNGTVEVCLLTDRLQVLCPELRTFHPDRVRKDHWITSSDVFWSEPLRSDRVVRPPSILTTEDAEPVLEVDEAGGDTQVSLPSTCDPNFEDMLASTWRVETTKWLGSAFYIGGGRFITAHHVIDGVPPFVTLTQGDRAIPAAVLGSDPSVDIALLGVFDLEQVASLPAADLRVPDREYIGRDVYLVGYPRGGPLTVSFGGIVSRVWEDEIQTTSAGAPGNSGGPMFDRCGDVIGVLWAGSRSSNFSHSGEVLSQSLDDLDPAWPRLPTDLPQALASYEESFIWHYGSEPPHDVDCSKVDADIWVGLAGGTLSLSEFRDSIGLEYVGRCNGGATRVAGFQMRKSLDAESAGQIGEAASRATAAPPCVASSPGQISSGEIIREGDIGIVLHKSVEEFGVAPLATLNTTTRCPGEFNSHMRVDF
ncbi:MAG: trypsin-like peptidase domain-containing protein, partial [Chloroflexi bacterium]|nr:trypsin-like peptidase domain-containing protein [Chloroflexota bacterium]